MVTIVNLRGGVSRTMALNVNLRCPACRKDSVFLPVPDWNDVYVNGDSYTLGHRFCGNSDCKAHVFIVTRAGRPIASYPPPGIDFNRERIPESVASAFEEALVCHTNGCFRGASMLVRRSLEEVCTHVGASGATLYDRIEALKTRVVLPEGLLEALHDIRLLGNDAAHVDARSYDLVGEAESAAGIEVVRLVLGNLFQTDAVVERLRGLKRS
jgi:hypothetical protein